MARSRWNLRVFAIAMITSVAAACGSDGPGEPEQEDLPGPDAAALWSYLQEQGYPQNWELWPGLGEFYEGSEPHGMLLTTYLDATALTALQQKAGSMPDGAIIVKENYMPDSTLAAITTMYKIAGYDGEHNDWFWAKYAPDGAVEASGKVEGCQSCHSAVASNDYIFSGPLK